MGVLPWGLQEVRGHGPEARQASESWPGAGSLSRACQLMCGVPEEAWPEASGWKLMGRGLPNSRPALGPDSPFPKPPQSLSPRRTAWHQPMPQSRRASNCAGSWPRWNGCCRRCKPVIWGFHEQPLRPSWRRPSDVSGVRPAGQSGEGPGAEASPDWCRISLTWWMGAGRHQGALPE